jgi:hypothetical protein
MTLEKAIDLACEKLPDEWRIRIDLEHGYGGVIAIRPDGTEVDMHEDETDMTEQVCAVLRLAHDEAEADKLSLENDQDVERRGQ